MKKISENIYEIEKEKDMLVPAKVFASEKLMSAIKKDKTLEQIKNVAKLPGIIKNAIAMPDAHQGYGFPIGGVAAFDLKSGIISPGGVGYDINCGVRILATNIKTKDFLKKRKEILHDLKRTIPTGVGRGHDEKLSLEELDKVLVEGAEYVIKKGFGTKDDLQRCEEYGKIENAIPKEVSQRAKARGRAQLGTLGAGNHFLDVLEIEEIFDDKTAKTFGLEKNTVAIMIHCGSRGLGHQVASDYIQLMEKSNKEKLPDRELVYAKINSELGQKYFGAMNASVNFAFANRQMIMHYVRQVLEKYFPKNKNHLVYDVCHNIAKIEEHVIDGKKQKVCVHRKGATRAFGAGRKEIPEVYRKVGQPVIIPGSMATPSYILVGTKKAEEISFGSTAHGAGRLLSRTKAIESLNEKDIEKDLAKKDILLETSSKKLMKEECCESYKDIDEVIKVSDKLGIAKKVAKLKPLAVMIG